MTDPAIPAITLPGRSGCSVCVQRLAARFVVVKSTANPDYAPRLKRQMLLQRRYRERNRIDSVSIPAVIDERDVDAGYSATMEYIGLLTCTQFIARASIESLERLAMLLWQVIEQELAWALPRPIDAGVFVAKLEEIRCRTHARSSEQIDSRLDSIRSWFESQGTLVLPSSMCHGDLTLSNILVSPDGDRIALIDLLDSFVESPVLDMVKLRQDTLFGWSSRLADEPTDKIRAALALRHLDRLLHARFLSCASYSRYHTGLQSLNLARTLPYLRDASMRQFVITSISQLGY